MQIVIDISEELYEANNRGLEAGELWDLRVAVKNGTPLPKGHGRLIDADEFEKMADKKFEYITSPLLDHIKVRDVYNLLEATPTVIEADNAESEG